jgi:hypothetical protein
MHSKAFGDGWKTSGKRHVALLCFTQSTPYGQSFQSRIVRRVVIPLRLARSLSRNYVIDLGTLVV